MLNNIYLQPLFALVYSKLANQVRIVSFEAQNLEHFRAEAQNIRREEGFLHMVFVLNRPDIKERFEECFLLH